MTTIAELILKADYRQVTGATKAVDGLADTAKTATSTIKSLALAMGAAFGVREIIQAADAWRNLTNRLTLVTTSTEQLGAAQEQLFDIAQRTRASLSATAEVYQRLAQNAGALGLTLDEVGTVTERINKLIAISGTSAQSAEAALTQLGQAFASGTLRGEELNSVMEQAPALAMAIAEGMGVTVGELRKLGEEGKITAEAVVKALEQQGDKINEQFANMVPTVGQAMTQMGNSMTRFIGRVDELSGSTTGLGSVISDLSRVIDNINLGPVVEFTQKWGTAISGIIDDINNNLIPATTGKSGFIELLTRGFMDLPVNVRAAAGLVNAELVNFYDNTIARLDRAGQRMRAVVGKGTWSEANDAFDETVRKNNALRDAAIDRIFEERDATINLSNEKRRLYELEQEIFGGDSGALGASVAGKRAPAVDDKKKKERLTDLADLRLSLEDQMQTEVNAQMDRRAMLEEMFASETEAEMLRYQAKKDMLAEYLESAGLSEEEARIKRETLEAEHQERMAQISADALAKDKTTLSNRLGTTEKFLSDVYNATGRHSNRMTKLIQTVGAAQATVNAYVAASQALADPSVPFFAKFAAVAQVIATGMGLANAIKSGGKAGAGAAGGGAVDTSGISSQQAAPVRAAVVDFRIQSRGIWRDDDVAELMQVIGDRVKDGAKFGKVEFLTA